MNWKRLPGAASAAACSIMHPLRRVSELRIYLLLEIDTVAVVAGNRGVEQMIIQPHFGLMGMRRRDKMDGPFDFAAVFGVAAPASPGRKCNGSRLFRRCLDL